MIVVGGIVHGPDRRGRPPAGPPHCVQVAMADGPVGNEREREGVSGVHEVDEAGFDYSQPDAEGVVVPLWAECEMQRLEELLPCMDQHSLAAVFLFGPWPDGFGGAKSNLQRGLELLPGEIESYICSGHFVLLGIGSIDAHAEESSGALVETGDLGQQLNAVIPGPIVWVRCRQGKSTGDEDCACCKQWVAGFGGHPRIELRPVELEGHRLMVQG